MKRNPLVSVVIPTRNEEKNILRCLKSLKKQKNSGTIEIILVDNHSEDSTLSLAGPYVSRTIVAGPERSRQRNIGAKHASGKWLLFLDADMQARSNLLGECLSLAQETISAPIIVVDEFSKGYNFLGRALALERNCYRGTPSLLLAARFFYRSHFLALGGYDETLVAGEDWDLTQRFLKKGAPIKMTRKTYVYHHEPKASLITLLKKEIYYIKHIGRYAKKQPTAFSYQGSFLYRGFLWIRNWRKLIKYPFLTATFLGYKFVVWLMWTWYKKSSPFQGFMICF
jgi:glycosyltransferase involved in cell wall biosynthesis